MKCLIVDDEPIARRGMKRLLEQYPDLELMGMLGSAEEAAEFLASNEVDLVFLDIQMPGLSGIEFAKTIPDSTMVVFTTAYSEYALDSYEVDALDYLVKPIDPQRLEKAINKARAYCQLLNSSIDQAESPLVNQEFLIVKADRRFVRIRFSEILFVEGLKDYVILHLNGRKIVSRQTIKGMEELLPVSKFQRVNKSYVVNIDAIDSFDSNDVFIGGNEIAIGQAYKNAVMKRLLG